MLNEKRKWEPTNPGSPIREIREPVVHDDGTITVEVTGKEDWQGYINSFAESVDIHSILARYQAGEILDLNMVSGVYADVTNMPKTYAEFLQQQIDARSTFDRLPAEIRNKFNNDPNQFMSTAGEEDWLEKLGVVKAEDVKECEVKAEDVKEREVIES